MDWFKRKKEALKPADKKELPDGLWIKCESCGEIIYKKEALFMKKNVITILE